MEPVEPVRPVGPMSPVTRVGPTSPVVPGAPVGPVGPMSPVTPAGPTSPVEPVEPAGPVGPAGPTPPGVPVKISVIIPAWNAADTIARTLDSLLAQTMPHWEAIVVDDGSTDDTAAIVGTYRSRDERVRLVRQANGGLSAARNAGIRHASHDWLHFLDADDWMAPTAFARFASAVADDPSLDGVHCGWARVTADRRTIAEQRCWQVGDLFSTFATRCAFAVHACLVWRAAVEAAGGFDPSIRISQDWVLWQRLARLGARFGGLPDTLAFYAHRADSLSNDIAIAAFKFTRTQKQVLAAANLANSADSILSMFL